MWLKIFDVMIKYFLLYPSLLFPIWHWYIFAIYNINFGIYFSDILINPILHLCIFFLIYGKSNLTLMYFLLLWGCSQSDIKRLKIYDIFNFTLKYCTFFPLIYDISNVIFCLNVVYLERHWDIYKCGIIYFPGVWSMPYTHTIFSVWLILNWSESHSRVAKTIFEGIGLECALLVSCRRKKLNTRAPWFLPEPQQRHIA